jgi:glycosyltransferase involved in cell wall biosynthesis
MNEKTEKVLFISSSPFFQWRGTPIRVGFNLLALAESGRAVDLLTVPLGEERAIPGVRIVRVPNFFFVRDIPIGPSLAKAGFDVILFFAALGLALRHRYGVIHCLEDTGPIGVVVARLTGSKVVFEKHSDPSSYKMGFLRNLVMWLYGRAERFSVRHADAVIGTGRGLADQMSKIRGGRGVYHIFDIPSSLVQSDPKAAAKIREDLKKSPGERLVTYVGSFAVYQGIDIMFRAMIEVAARHREARLVIVGGIPEEIAGRKQWLREHGIEGSVTFVGKVPPDRLPDYLAASDVLLSPRQAGVNTPLKVLDYLKAGRAIVATDTVSNRMILDEDTALLVEAGVSGFAEGICRVLADEELRANLGERGSKLLEEKYSFQEYARRLGECYRSLRPPGP